MITFNIVIILIDFWFYNYPLFFSYGEVFRPSTKNTNLDGITDDKDPLKFDIIFQNGTNEYTNWFNKVANKRYKFKKK